MTRPSLARSPVMLLGLGLIWLACAGWVVAVGGPRPGGAGVRRCDLGRMSPRSSLAVDAADVRRRLLRCSVPAVTADRVVGRARDRGLSSGAMWRWMDAYDADGLVVAVDAGLTEDVLLRHLRGGTSPDWTSLELFARLANDALPGGIPLEEIIDLDAVPQLEDLDLAGELDRWGTPLDDDRLGGSGARPHELRWSQPDGGWPNPA